MITGIQPEMAQSIVEMGVEVSAIVTQGTLQSGIAYAMSRLSAKGARWGRGPEIPPGRPKRSAARSRDLGPGSSQI